MNIYNKREMKICTHIPTQTHPHMYINKQVHRGRKKYAGAYTHNVLLSHTHENKHKHRHK